jgi:hypothetical protein
MNRSAVGLEGMLAAQMKPQREHAANNAQTYKSAPFQSKTNVAPLQSKAKTA